MIKAESNKFHRYAKPASYVFEGVQPTINLGDGTLVEQFLAMADAAQRAKFALDFIGRDVVENYFAQARAAHRALQSSDAVRVVREAKVALNSIGRVAVENYLAQARAAHRALQSSDAVRVVREAKVALNSIGRVAVENYLAQARAAGQEMAEIKLAHRSFGKRVTEVQEAAKYIAPTTLDLRSSIINTTKNNKLQLNVDNIYNFTFPTSTAIISALGYLPKLLADHGYARASNEIKEAIYDISRKEPDCTGAIQHSAAALEAVARGATGKPEKTLGRLVKSLDLPRPLAGIAQKFWGFACENGRHIREDRTVAFEEAKLCVDLSCAFCVYIVTRKNG